MTSQSGAGDGEGQVRALAPGRTPPPPDRAAAGGPPEPPPAPGELHIKEKRTWKTWQLATAMMVAALVGMALNYNSSGASSSASSGGTKGYKLPPPAATGGAAPTTTTPSSTLPPGSTRGATTHSATSGGATHQHGSVSTTTTAPATTTTTGATTTTTTSGAAPGPLQLLVPATQMHGNWTSPAFSITAAPWNIGWAFQCTPAPASGPSFQVFVAPVGGKPGATPPVSETGASGQQVTQVQSTGSQVVMVQAPANCLWAVKVTGN